jgi:hypothetical protein
MQQATIRFAALAWIDQTWSPRMERLMQSPIRSAAYLAAASLVASSIGCGLAGLAFNSRVGSGKVGEQVRPLSGFSKVSQAGSSDVTVSIGPKFEVVVSADDNLLEMITTEVDGDTLEIGSRGSFTTRNPVTIRVTMPQLTTVELAGSGDIAIGELATEKLSIALAGSGSVVARGKADDVEISLAGSGDVELLELAAKTAEVTVAGSGGVELNVSDSLEASVMGSGDVLYTGNPKQVTRSVVGSGEIEPKN